MPTFWLSYTDDSRPKNDRHLHVITAADDVDSAIGIARGMGAGATVDVAVSDLEDCIQPPAEYMGRVLTNADIDAMEAAIGLAKRQAAAIAEVAAIIEPAFASFIGMRISSDLIATMQARLDAFIPSVNAAKARHMPHFWLSFVDASRPAGDQFVGACIVQAWDTIGALEAAWDAGCNPGGEIEFVELNDDARRLTDGYTNRLLTRDDCAAVEDIWAELV